MTIKDDRLFHDCWHSQTMLIMQILINSYMHRMNTIPGKNVFSRAVISGIFKCHVTDYQFLVSEIYKRLAMRTGALPSKADDYDFERIPAEEMRCFRAWLVNIGTWNPPDGKMSCRLWTLGINHDGKDFLQLAENEFTLNYIQLLNTVFDNLKQWKNLAHGIAWIQHSITSAAFQYC